MPNASLVVLGTNHPYIERGVTYPPSVVPTDTLDPHAPPPAPPTLDAYLAAAPPGPAEADGQQFSAFKLKPATFILHENWRNTALRPAMHERTLHLPSVTPAMLKALTTPQRTTLMDSLGRDITRITWRNAKGRRMHRTRHRFHHFRVGHAYKVNGATALTLLMAEHASSHSTRRAMSAGLPWVVDGLSGKDSTLFSAKLTARTLRHVMPRLTVPADPAETRRWVNAAGTLVQRYLEQNTDETPISIRNATLRLLSAINQGATHDASVFGATLGAVLAGGRKYCANLTNEDVGRRWRRTAVANLIWAGQNCNPFFFAAGPVSIAAVLWATVWERRHPPRAFSAVFQHLRGELELMINQGRTPYLDNDGNEVLRWIALSEHLNGY